MVMNSTLNCLGWMQNQNDQVPCTTAQEVGQLCVPEYTVVSINFEQSQYVPNGSMVNGCTWREKRFSSLTTILMPISSWSIYNLLSACSYCVGQSQYISWNTWTTSCGSYVSNNSYLPSEFRIPQGIPFWAAKNPSTWENATFNVTEAANIAAAAQPDVTGGPLPTATTTVSPSSHGSVGAVIGGVLGGIAIFIIGVLFVIYVVRHRRNQRIHTARGYGPSFDSPQPVTLPMIQNQTPMQSTLFGRSHEPFAPITPYLISPFHSTTSLAPRMPHVPPNEQSAATASADGADMVSPFLATSPSRQASRSNTSALTVKAAEAFSERVLAPPRTPRHRARLNPPPYSTSGEAGSSVGEEPARRRPIKKETRRKNSVSGAAGFASVPTGENTAAPYAGTRMEMGCPRAMTPVAGTPIAVESTASGDDVDHLEDGTWYQDHT